MDENVFDKEILGVFTDYEDAINTGEGLLQNLIYQVDAYEVKSFSIKDKKLGRKPFFKS